MSDVARDGSPDSESALLQYHTGVSQRETSRRERMKQILFAALAVLALWGCSGEKSPEAAGSGTQQKQESQAAKAGSGSRQESAKKEPDKSEKAEARYTGPAAPHIKALGSEKMSTCDTAAEALREMGEAAVEPLIKALRDRSSRIRANAAWVLGRLKDERSVEPLVKALKDGSAGVRAYAALALGKIGDKKAVPALEEALNDRDEDVGKTAQQALDKLMPPEKTKPAREHADKAGRTPEEVLRAYLKALKGAKWGTMYDLLTKDVEAVMETALATIKRMPEPETLKCCRDMGITREKLDVLKPREFFILLNNATMMHMAGPPYEMAFLETGDMKIKSCKVNRDLVTAEIVNQKTKRRATVNLLKEDGLWKVMLRKW
jgi:hypothetical protein